MADLIDGKTKAPPAAPTGGASTEHVGTMLQQTPNIPPVPEQMAAFGTVAPFSSGVAPLPPSPTALTPDPISRESGR